MAWSSVTVCHGGPKKMQSEENSEWLRLAGIDVIKLKHKKGRGSPSIRGFQRTDIYKTEAADGRVSYKYSHSSMRDTAEPCNGRMPLVFTPDKTDGYLYAYLPDTPFNRKKLLNTFCPGADWEICDKELEEELRAIYLQSAVEEKRKKTQAEIISEQAKEIKRLQAAMAQEVEVAEHKEKIAAGVTEAQQEAATVKIIEGPTAKAIAKAKQELRDKIKSEEEAKQPQLINKMKQKKTNYWLTKEYQEVLKPIISKRFEMELPEFMKARFGGENGDSAGVDNNS